MQATTMAKTKPFGPHWWFIRIISVALILRPVWMDPEISSSKPLWSLPSSVGDTVDWTCSCWGRLFLSVQRRSQGRRRECLHVRTSRVWHMIRSRLHCRLALQRWLGSNTSAKNISVWADWLRQRGCAPSEPSEPPRWPITPRPASIPRVELHIALRSPFRRFFSLCRSPILNKHSGVVADCDHTSEWVHCVHACIGIAMHKYPRNCADPRNLAKSEWDQKLGKIECVFSLYDKRDENEMLSIYSRVSRIYTPHRSFHLHYPCISVHPPSLLNDILGGCDCTRLEMHLEAEIEWPEKCTCRPW